MSGYPRPRNALTTPLSAVATALGVAPPTVAREVGLTGVTHATSQVRPGYLYAGLAGARHHGASFARQAAEAGALALLTDPAGADLASGAGLAVLVVDDPRTVLGRVADLVYGEPSRRLPVIGITGTAGKTSTAHLVADGLRAAGEVPGVIGTVETRLGDLVVDSTRTTPEATDLHALLAVGLEEGVTTLVMEASSHALALGRVEGVRFAAGGYTNFGSDHLDFHADRDEYFAAKARLFDGRCESEILNADDPALDRLVRPATQTYSALGDPRATWYAAEVTAVGIAQRFLIHGPGGLTVPGGVGLPGRHNVANALLAVALLAAVGVEPKLAAAAVADARGAPGRLQRVTAGADLGIEGIVDYAHKPDAVVAVLTALRSTLTAEGRIICVLGAGGDRDRGKRPVMGAAAAQGADVVIVTDDNPRTEDPGRVRSEVLAGAAGGGPAVVLEVPGRREAIAAAVAHARAGDVVALLGKGHERGQEIAGTVFPFDDAVELAAALGAAGGHGPVPRGGRP